MRRIAVLMLSIGVVSPAFGVTDKYHVTEAEKAACTADAIRFCYGTFPDENRLIGCMKQNLTQLSAVCRVAFEAGIKRRRL